jgi:type II secretory pathway predicted ATPase ExeA
VEYLQYYHFQEEPFSNSPSKHFYFESKQHTEALLKMEYAAKNMKGLGVLAGEIGAGKTTIAKQLIEKLDESEFEASMLVIVQPQLKPSWIFRKIALQVGIMDPPEDRVRLISVLYNKLIDIYEEGRKTVVIIDEAQMLSGQEMMQEIRGLLNFESGSQKLITFLFFGLPQIEDNLRLDPALEQRVAIRQFLSALKHGSSIEYIKHRLKVAGGNADLLTDEALHMVYKYSRGIPRQINTICDNALLEGFFQNKDSIDVNIIRDVVSDLRLDFDTIPKINQDSRQDSRRDISRVSYVGVDESDSSKSNSDLKEKLKKEILDELKRDRT